MKKKNIYEGKWEADKEIWNIAMEQAVNLENGENGRLAFFNYWEEESKIKKKIDNVLTTKYKEYYTEEDEQEKEFIVQQIYNSFLFKFGERFYNKTELLSKSLLSPIEDKYILRDEINSIKQEHNSELELLDFIIKQKNSDLLKSDTDHIREAINHTDYKTIVYYKLKKMKFDKRHKKKNEFQIKETYIETLRKKLRNLK